MSEPTRDEQILAVADALTEDYVSEAIYAEEGRARGRTGLTTHEGCKSANAICAAEDWAQCSCFIQACAAVEALWDIAGRVVIEKDSDGHWSTTFIGAKPRCPVPSAAHPESGDSGLDEGGSISP